MPDAVAICDGEGRILLANAQLERMLGWPLASVLGRPIESLLPPASAERHAEHRRRFLADPTAERPEATGRRLMAQRADGAPLLVDILLATTEVDGIRVVAATLRDTTTRWQTADALRAAGAAIATSATAIAFASVDGRVDYVNDAFMQLWGYEDRTEVIGRRATEFWADRELAEVVGTALRHRGSWIGELMARRRDGEERRVQMSANLVLDDAGEPIRFMATALDVSELRSTQQTLRVREEQLRAIMASLPVVVMAFDREGHFTLCEGHGLDRIGLQPRQVVGRFLFDVYPDAPNLREAFELARAGESVSFTTEIDDTRFEVVLAPLNEASGTNGVIGIAFDVTEKHLAEQALALSEEQVRQSQKMEAIGQLAGGIAHDFNNLLTVVRGYTEILLEQFAAGDPRRANCDEIRRAAERASTLTRQLLAFSRRQMLQPRVLDLNTVVGDLQRMLARVVGDDLSLAVGLQPGLWNVMADPGQIEQILVNLAVNARDAMPDGGTLHVSTANVTTSGPTPYRDFKLPAGEWVRIQVTDTGHGMEAATLRRIFEPFFTTKHPGQGTGLGLATVFGIIKQSEGFIDVASTPGAGTTFQIFLPRALDPVQVEQVPITRGPRRSETILLVEDEDGVRDLTRLFLESAGYHVMEATDGRDALRVAAATSEPIDVLVTDVVMPHMDGPALVAALAPLRPEMKVLFISGYTEDAVLLRGGSRQSGALLQKPFSKPALLESVAHALGR